MDENAEDAAGQTDRISQHEAAQAGGTAPEPDTTAPEPTDPAGPTDPPTAPDPDGATTPAAEPSEDDGA